MKCPKCGRKMLDKCCLKCGCLINGRVINNEDKKDKNIDLKIMNEDKYDIMLHNDNWYIPFIFGPFYLAYKNHVVLSIITSIFDVLLFCFIGINVGNNIYLSVFNKPLILLYLFLNRLVYAMFSNVICLKLDKINIEKQKRKYQKNYRMKIHNKDSFLHVIFSIAILGLIVLILIIVRRIQNGTIDNFIF